MNEYLLTMAIKNAVKESFSNLSTTTEIESGSSDCMQILRTAIASEISAINLYTSLANMAENPIVKKVLLDVIKEEKTHIGEFESLLKDLDPEYKQENINGSKEVEEMKGNL